MDLVSIYCSGESFEKAVVLFLSAYKSNEKFYNRFDTIYVFYGDDLQKSKKDERERIVPGSIRFYQDILGEIITIEEIFCKLKEKSIINDRDYNKYHSFPEKFRNFERINCLYSNIPYYLLREKEKEKILEYIKKCVTSKVKFVRIEARKLLLRYFECTPRDYYSILYGFNFSECVVSHFNLYNMDVVKRNHMTDRIIRNIILSPNVYMFIGLIQVFCDNYMKSEYLFGIKEMNRIRRVSYDAAIEKISATQQICEPRNAVFGKLLDDNRSVDNDVVSYTIKKEIDKLLTIKV